jgi:hypothetical protein
MLNQLSFAVLAVVFACATPAQAQRVFVSATGSDGNPCTFASPCRSFQHAHDVAPAHGEIDVLDPAGYGAVTITKAISIQGHGFSGITVASGANGITINAGSSDAVTLNGLIIDGAHAGFNGIVFNSGGGLTVNDCVIQNFVSGVGNNGNGIFMQPASGSIKFAITNTILTNNAFYGFFYFPQGGSTATSFGVFDRVTATNNGITGILCSTFSAGGATKISITNSTSSNNGGSGIVLITGSTAMTGSIDNAATNNNAVYGILVEGVATVTLSRSIVTANGNDGVRDATVHTFYTFGNNQVALNNPDGITSLNSATYSLH